MAAASRIVLKFLPFGFANGNITLQNYAIDSSAKKVAFVFAAFEAATITHLGFRYGARTGTPPVHKISLQGVDGSGNPDGTVLGGGSPASATFTPPATTAWNGTWQWVALANSVALTRGQMVSSVIEYSSGTVDVSNNGTFTYNDVSVNDPGRLCLPYPDVNTGSWAKQSSGAPIWGYKSSTTVYGYPVIGQQDTSVTSSGNRAALKFSLPAGWGTSFKLAGLRFCGLVTSASTWTVGVWNAAGTALASATIDTDQVAAPDSSLRFFECYFSDSTLPTLTFGTTYYLGIQRGTQDVILCGFGFNSQAEMDALRLPGACLSTWNGSAWSDTTTTLPEVELILDDFTPPAGGATVQQSSYLSQNIGTY